MDTRWSWSACTYPSSGEGWVPRWLYGSSLLVRYVPSKLSHDRSLCLLDTYAYVTVRDMLISFNIIYDYYCYYWSLQFYYSTSLATLSKVKVYSKAALSNGCEALARGTALSLEALPYFWLFKGCHQWAQAKMSQSSSNHSKETGDAALSHEKNRSSQEKCSRLFFF